MVSRDERRSRLDKFEDELLQDLEYYFNLLTLEEEEIDELFEPLLGENSSTQSDMADEASAERTPGFKVGEKKTLDEYQKLGKFT